MRPEATRCPKRKASRGAVWLAVLALCSLPIDAATAVSTSLVTELLEPTEPDPCENAQPLPFAPPECHGLPPHRYRVRLQKVTDLYSFDHQEGDPFRYPFWTALKGGVAAMMYGDASAATKTTISLFRPGLPERVLATQGEEIPGTDRSCDQFLSLRLWTEATLYAFCWTSPTDSWIYAWKAGEWREIYHPSDAEPDIPRPVDYYALPPAVPSSYDFPLTATRNYADPATINVRSTLGEEAILVTDGESVSSLLDTRTAPPSLLPDGAQLIGHESDRGHIAMLWEASPETPQAEQILVVDDGTESTRWAGTGDIVLPEGFELHSIGQGDIFQRAGGVAFVASYEAHIPLLLRRGLFFATRDGIRSIVHHDTIDPATGDRFAENTFEQYQLRMRDPETVVFKSTSAFSRGDYYQWRAGTLTHLFNEDDFLAPDSELHFLTSWPVAANEELILLQFHYSTSLYPYPEHEGSFAYIDDELIPIVVAGQEIDGKTVAPLIRNPYPQARSLDGRQVLLQLEFDDESHALYLATVVPEPDATTLAGAALVALAGIGHHRRARR